jgi:1,4-dihydroxy-2-naphthoate octaprenyltransferase
MNRNRAVQILSIAGLIVAVLSALEAHLPWLASLCGYLGDGCRNAEVYNMFTIPIAYVGIGFFTVLIFTGTRDLILLHFQGFSSSQFQG